MSYVFVGASAFKYAKDLVAWNISKVSTMTQMLGKDNLAVWNTLNSCHKKTLWNAWYDIVYRGGGEGGICGLDSWPRACVFVALYHAFALGTSSACYVSNRLNIRDQ